MKKKMTEYVQQTQKYSEKYTFNLTQNFLQLYRLYVVFFFLINKNIKFCKFSFCNRKNLLKTNTGDELYESEFIKCIVSFVL